MNFLPDINVVSEWVKARPDPGLVAWLEEADEDRVFISVVTLAEIRYGIDRIKAGRRRDRLADWLQNELPVRFENRVLPIDSPVADSWGRLLARSEAAGRALGAIDAFIAATAEVHGLALVTRNEPDFKRSVATIVNPWRAS